MHVYLAAMHSGREVEVGCCWVFAGSARTRQRLRPWDRRSSLLRTPLLGWCWGRTRRRTRRGAARQGGRGLALAPFTLVAKRGGRAAD
ncbi:MAG: hypothetical protein ACI82G_003233 [Bradymonadia bacterium]|jgi:hypothetical protein